jgi:riboflavin kinase/FMN adenylyltransferase
MQQRTVLVVGNFDGVHRGHQSLFACANALADQHNATVIAVTFDEHPVSVLRPDQAPPMLMQHNQRAAALADLGVSQIEWLHPTPELLGLPPEQFIETLVDRFNPVAMVEGPNFRFGKKRRGDPQMLRQLGQRFAFDVQVLDLMSVPLRDKTLAPISSSLVRWLVGHGRVTDAQICLGRPFALMGEVVRGDQRGKGIGYPTANLNCGKQIIPTDGVYAGHALIDRARHLAAISIGTKPTFGQHHRTVEAYLIGFDGDLYGRTVELALTRFLRDQYWFPDTGQLVRQMDHDVRRIVRLGGQGLLAAADLQAECV